MRKINSMPTTASIKWTISGFALASLLACSGGGNTPTPTPNPAPVITSFTAAQGTITTGGSTTLTGVFTNGTGSVNDGIGSVQSGVAISTGPLQATTTFLLTVTGAGGTVSSPTTVTVGPKTIADRLDYTNPASGTYTLVKDTVNSTPAHLVLNLMGPVGTLGSGVGFYLSADTSKVAWAKVSLGDAEFVKNGVFNLGSSPQLLKSKVNGDQLQAGVYQKGTTVSPFTFTATSVLASVALDLKPNVTPLGVVTFGAVNGKALLTNGSSAPTPIVISTGTITAN